MPDLGETKLNVVELFFEQPSTHFVLVSEVLASPKIFAEWQITKPSGTVEQFSVGAMNSVLCAIRRTSGAGNIAYGWLESPDGTSWSTLGGTLTETNSAFQARVVTDTDLIFSDDTDFIALVTYNSNGTTAGEVQRFLGHILIRIPQGAIIKRIV